MFDLLKVKGLNLLNDWVHTNPGLMDKKWSAGCMIVSQFCSHMIFILKE